ncbi:hypothetical protein [Parvicella tangerina]|nr:hypothetical protein [Parvicella tangerina]
MMKLLIYSAFIFVFASCVSTNAEQIAEDWCECKKIEIHQSSLQGEQCFQEWDKKYGKLEFNDQQVAKFNEIIKECMDE